MNFWERHSRRAAVASTALVLVLAPTAPVWADPLGQPGVTDVPDGSQPGVTDVPAPPAVVSNPDPGPIYGPTPPGYDGNYRTDPVVYEPSYTTPVDHSRAWSGASPVLPIAPPKEDDTVRVGVFKGKLPAWIPQPERSRLRRTINVDAAYLESWYAYALRRAGVPDREADRRAAAMITTSLITGTIVAIPFALLGCAGGFALGLSVGAVMIPGVGAVPGGPLGCAGGAALLGGIAFLGGAAAGATAAYALSTGEEGDRTAPRHDPILEPRDHTLELKAADAKRLGLPATKITITKRGAIEGNIGAQKVGWKPPTLPKITLPSVPQIPVPAAVPKEVVRAVQQVAPALVSAPAPAAVPARATSPAPVSPPAAESAPARHRAPVEVSRTERGGVQATVAGRTFTVEPPAMPAMGRHAVGR